MQRPLRPRWSLLGLAFDSDFDATGGELYLAYTDVDGGSPDGSCMLARYESTDGGQSFAPAMGPGRARDPPPARRPRRVIPEPSAAVGFLVGLLVVRRSLRRD